MDAISSGTAAGKAFLGLAGEADCGDSQVVVSRRRRRRPGEQDHLILRFYPASEPDGDGTLCQPWISNGWGTYLPLNDTRFSTPTVGYGVEIPEEFGTVAYVDQTAIVPRYNVCSAFYVTVTRPDPKLTPALSPTPVPTTRPGQTLCAGSLQGP